MNFKIILSAMLISVSAAAADVSLVNCDIQVGDVYKMQDRDGSTIWGKTSHQHQAFYTQRFPKNSSQIVPEIDLGKIKWTEEGMKIGNDVVHDSLPVLPFDKEINTLIAFVNVADPAKEYAAGNYVRFQTNIIGQENDPTYTVTAIVFRNHQPVLSGYTSVDKDDTRNGILAYNPVYAVAETKATVARAELSKKLDAKKITTDQFMEGIKQIGQDTLKAMKVGDVATLMMHCELD